MSLGSAIMTLGVIRYPNDFAGAEVLPNGQVVVYVVKGQGNPFLVALPPLTDAAAGPSYVIWPMSNSWADMSAMTLRIAGDDADRGKRGIELAQWGPDVRENKVVITMRHYDAVQADYLVQRYGSALVAVSTVSMPDRARRC